MVAEPYARDVESLLQSVYEVFVDYALKNPFYEAEMPIRCELFDANLDTLFATYNAKAT